MPAQDVGVGVAGAEHAVGLSTIQALVEAPSVIRPSSSTNQALRGPGLACGLFGQGVGQQADGLDVAAAPAVVRQGDHAHALRRLGLGRGVIDGLAVTTTLGGVADSGKAWSRGAVSARDLQIDDAVAHAVAAHGLAQDDEKRRLAHRRGGSGARRDCAQPRQMALRVGQLAVEDGPDLIDAVGELKAAILDMDAASPCGDDSGR